MRMRRGSTLTRCQAVERTVGGCSKGGARCVGEPGQSSYVRTCPAGCLPWAAVDEELDILRRSRSEITDALSSSSSRELEGGAERGVEEEGSTTTRTSRGNKHARLVMK